MPSTTNSLPGNAMFAVPFHAEETLRTRNAAGDRAVCAAANRHSSRMIVYAKRKISETA